jgi:hypothetical protein
MTLEEMYKDMYESRSLIANHLKADMLLAQHQDTEIELTAEDVVRLEKIARSNDLDVVHLLCAERLAMSAEVEKLKLWIARKPERQKYDPMTDL